MQRNIALFCWSSRFGTLKASSLRKIDRMATHAQRRNYLYTLRRIRGFRQKQLALLLGYRGTTQISRFESGATLPPLQVALLLQLALGAQLSEIYVDLYADLASLILKRATRLSPALARSIRGRVLGKD